MFFLKKYSSVVSVIVLVLFLAGCAGTKKTTTTDQYEELVQVSLKVEKENLRDAPNGNKVGEAHQGDILGLVERRGNWCQIHNETLGNVWIWGPSLGYTSVSPLNIRSWIGDASTAASEKSILEVFGRPTSVEMLGSHLAVYHYNNYVEQGQTLFGTHQIVATKVYLDRRSRTVSQVELVLPPFKGNTKKAIPALGLPSVKSSGIDFERARYINKFAGISVLELKFLKGDFEKIESVSAFRTAPELWRRKLDVSDKKVTIVNGKLALQMTLTNNDQVNAYASPKAEVELYQGSKYLGKWNVQQDDFIVDPGKTVVTTMPIPVEAHLVEVKKVAARAEILQMYVLPGGK